MNLKDWGALSSEEQRRLIETPGEAEKLFVKFSEEVMPGVKSKIRGELDRLKTDLGPNKYEALHRETIEHIMGMMERCNLRRALKDFPLIETAEKLIATQDPRNSGLNRFPKIHDLLIDTLVEIANNNCKCEFIKEEE